jgi:predicted PurR-regulated permease PerM
MTESAPETKPDDAPRPRRPLTVEMPIDIRSLSLSILAVGALIVLLRYAEEVLVPIVLSILISYALWPIVNWLVKRLKFPRTLAAALVLLATTAGLGWAAYSVRFQAINLVEQIPEATRLVQRELLRGRSRDSAIAKVQEAATAVQQTAEQAGGPDPAPRGVTRVRIEEPTFDAHEYVRWGSMGLLGLGGQLVLIFFLVFFLLQSGDMFKRKIVKIAGPTLSRKKITVEIMDEINKQIGGFLFVRVVTSVAVSVVTWLALWWMGVENAGVWGIAAGVLNSIPYFGPFIVSGALFVVGMVQFGNVGAAAWIAFVAMMITALEGWLLTPALQGRVAQMNEVAVFIGLLFWSWVWGFWGAILAVPMMMALKAVCDHVEDLQPVGELLGN